MVEKKPYVSVGDSLMGLSDSMFLQSVFKPNTNLALMVTELFGMMEMPLEFTGTKGVLKSMPPIWSNCPAKIFANENCWPS